MNDTNVSVQLTQTENSTETLTVNSTLEFKEIINEPNQRIFQGSCLDAPSAIERGSVSLIITSPPYPGVEKPESEYATFEDPMSFNKSHEFLAKVWEVSFFLLEDLGRL